MIQRKEPIGRRVIYDKLRAACYTATGKVSLNPAAPPGRGWDDVPTQLAVSTIWLELKSYR